MVSTPALSTAHNTFEMCFPAEQGSTYTMQWTNPIDNDNAGPPCIAGPNGGKFTPDGTILIIVIPTNGGPCTVNPKPACSWLEVSSTNQFTCADGSTGTDAKFCGCRGG